jgi:hypothetical protein
MILEMLVAYIGRGSRDSSVNIAARLRPGGPVFDSR